MISDLRSFIELLREHGELAEIYREVNPDLQMSTIMRKMEVMDRPAVFFHKVKGYDIPVVGNLLGTMKRNALALNTDVQGIPDKLTQALKNPIPPIIVKKSPVKAVTLLKKNSFELTYEWFNAEGEIVTKARTVHVFLDKKNWSKINIPKEIKTGLQSHQRDYNI